MKNDIPTFVKWAGGKKQLIEQFKPFFPKDIKRYHEPFVGGGAVAFFLIKNYSPQEVFLSDMNEELVNCYNVIKTDIDNLITELKKLKSKHSKGTYYKIRAEDPSLLSPLTKAARFIYLNKTCFNGLYRVNSKGIFNVPIGSYKNPAICSQKDLRGISKLLRNVEVSVMDFADVVKKSKKGDFIYFDPPYYPLSKTSSFTSYTKNVFLEDEQRRLAEVYKKLDRMGCKVMLSNSDHPFIRNLYSGYQINTVKASRAISCIGSGRGKINEIVVTNYDFK